MVLMGKDVAIKLVLLQKVPNKFLDKIFLRIIQLQLDFQPLEFDTSGDF